MMSVALLLYPIFANLYNEKVMEALIVDYDEMVSIADEDVLAEEYQKAAEYNSGSSEYSYDDVLWLSESGMMGYIEIPSIDVCLPIYHYTDDESLKEGVGHIETSSLPVGGASTHCLLAGHRGLPGSKLFTDLDQVEIGDVFYLHVAGQTLAYEVTSIEVVLPDETEGLGITAGEDLCTLVTCTPYGINSHRLLVTGTRTEYVEEEEEEADNNILSELLSLDMILVYVAIAETAAFIFLLAKRKRAA